MLPVSPPHATRCVANGKVFSTSRRLTTSGAWVPKDLVDNIDADCNARITRAKERKPRRLLIPVGGAGAQKSFVTKFVCTLKVGL